GDLQERTARANLVTDSELADIQSASRQVFAHRAVEQRIPALRKRVHDFRRDYEDRLQRPAVDRWMGMDVALDTKRADHPFLDGAFGKPAPGNVDLYDRAFHDGVTGNDGRCPSL